MVLVSQDTWTGKHHGFLALGLVGVGGKTWGIWEASEEVLEPASDSSGREFGGYLKFRYTSLLFDSRNDFLGTFRRDKIIGGWALIQYWANH
jgi:hypothetical protein